jgi:hypothetical protein
VISTARGPAPDHIEILTPASLCCDTVKENNWKERFLNLSASVIDSRIEPYNRKPTVNLCELLTYFTQLPDELKHGSECYRLLADSSRFPTCKSSSYFETYSN